VTTSICAGSSLGLGRVGGADVEEGHALEAQPLRQRARFLHQLGTRLDAVDVALPQRLEEQVVEDEAQVGLARAVVGQRRMALLRRQFLQQLLDELVQVVDLLELAPRVLVDAALAREDVQLLQQLDRLPGRANPPQPPRDRDADQRAGQRRGPCPVPAADAVRQPGHRGRRQELAERRGLLHQPDRGRDRGRAGRQAHPEQEQRGRHHAAAQ
jgi:hypothetical protein